MLMATFDPTGEPQRDLGFGAVVARESRRRLLNRDGSFNVRRQGLKTWSSLSLYQWLLTVSWPRYLALLVSFYLAVNVLFAGAYVAAGPGALAGSQATGPSARFLESFFFSVHTSATIGYGTLAPASLPAQILVTIEALVGLLGLALATGILFARFSRPTARILFSRTAVVAPFRGGRAVMFRIANARKSEMIELHATVLYSRFRPDASGRDFDFLRLERDQVTFFPLTWTIVHPIDDASPLRDLGPADLQASRAEFLVLLTGIDDTFGATVHARSSYAADEIEWGARFADPFKPPDEDGVLAVDLDRLHATQPAELP
jgi:inward rectifier potassium channel